jgi:hypothetical protein
MLPILISHRRRIDYYVKEETYLKIIRGQKPPYEVTPEGDNDV